MSNFIHTSSAVSLYYRELNYMNIINENKNKILQ